MCNEQKIKLMMYIHSLSVLLTVAIVNICVEILFLYFILNIVVVKLFKSEIK